MIVITSHKKNKKGMTQMLCRRATPLIPTFITSSPISTAITQKSPFFTNKSINQKRRPKTIITTRPMSCAQSTERSVIYGGGQGITVNSTVTTTAAIIFLHGLGDSGAGWATGFPLPNLPYVRTILPDAETQSVSLNGGMPMPSWFDLHGLDESSPDDSAGIERAVQRVVRIIDEIKIPSERIILAGFSQGGALALTAGLRCKQKIGGIVALSCWLPMRVEYPDKLGDHARDTPIFVAHGEDDVVVPLRFGKASVKLMNEIGLNVTFKSYSGMPHSACAEELEDVARFVKSLVP